MEETLDLHGVAVRVCCIEVIDSKPRIRSRRTVDGYPVLDQTFVPAIDVLIDQCQRHLFGFGHRRVARAESPKRCSDSVDPADSLIEHEGQPQGPRVEAIGGLQVGRRQKRDRMHR